MKKKT
jgi:hypothetical protein